MKHPRPGSPRYPLLEPYRTALARCVRCGSCLAVCPSFRTEHEESRSARGRMALIAAVLDGRLSVSAVFRDRLATCAGCLACEAACASGVPVTAIIQAAKEEALREAGPELLGSIIRAGLGSPLLMRSASWLGSRLLPALRELPDAGGEPAVPAPRLPVPEALPRSGAAGRPGRIALFVGCAANYFEQDMAGAAVRVLGLLGFEVIVPPDQTCCGKPMLSLGDRPAAESYAAQNAAAFSATKADAVVTACASCGLMLKKEYAALLREGTALPPVLDIHEVLAQHLPAAALAPVRKRVTWHDPCHLGRGQGLAETARRVLRSLPGLDLVEMEHPDRCCGFGGVMRITHRGLSLSIGDAKARDIIATRASVVATGCPGCRLQIADAVRRIGAPLPVLHTVQLVEEAMQGGQRARPAACGDEHTDAQQQAGAGVRNRREPGTSR